MDTIAKRLQQTPTEYEAMVMNVWFSWCYEKTNNRKSLQKALVCAPLFNWWQRELRKLEAQFLEETRYNPDKKYSKKVYAEFIVPVFDRFSKPLLKKIAP